jgi:DNA polymerase-4
VTLRCLFVDFDSFFASVEQHDDPGLRGKPVAVIPVLAESTCCLAASKEAKALGIKTGTGVREARARCPDIRLVLARPARYIELHKNFMAAIEDCIPHGDAASIDEVPCWLIGRERQPGNAIAIATRIKQRLVEVGISPSMTCSIGIAPNKFLAKTASDMRKPDGLTVIEQHDLPHALHELALRDLCGIGPSMEARLHAHGIRSTQALCAASREHLRRAWGSIEGERFWLQLRGFDLPERKTVRGSIGHSHVLGPELRSFEGMRSVLFKLLAKAGMRLRHEGYLAGGMAIRIRFVGSDRRFERDLAFAPIDETSRLLELLGKQLERLRQAERGGRWRVSRHPPLSVAVTLTGLHKTGVLSGELIPGHGRSGGMSRLLDQVNTRFGNNALYFGAMQEALRQGAAPMRIPFSTIPQTALEEDIRPHRRINGSTSVNAGHDVHELWLQRERQFKVLAEDTHRQSSQKREPRAQHRPSGAGGWNGGGQPESPSAPGDGLF